MLPGEPVKCQPTDERIYRGRSHKCPSRAITTVTGDERDATDNEDGERDRQQNGLHSDDARRRKSIAKERGDEYHPGGRA